MSKSLVAITLLLCLSWGNPVRAGLTIAAPDAPAPASDRNVQQVVPPGDYDSAVALKEQFEAAPVEDLDLMKFSNSICAELVCGSLTEAGARVLLDAFKDGIAKNEDYQRRLFDRLFSFANLMIAVGALGVSWRTARRRPAEAQ
jgi:hypothetical protein